MRIAVTRLSAISRGGSDADAEMGRTSMIKSEVSLHADGSHISAASAAVCTARLHSTSVLMGRRVMETGSAGGPRIASAATSSMVSHGLKFTSVTISPSRRPAAYDKPKRHQSCRGMRAAWQIQLGRRACFAG